MGNQATRAVFLDRDGVLIEDVDLLTEASRIRILPGVPEALARLKGAGYALVVVSNQAVVARGLLEEFQVLDLHQEVERRLMEAGAPALDGFYFCPHHPRATLPRYRTECPCRKPRPGMLVRASEALGIDLASSFMVGDRPTDILAGEAAGCRTVWVETGQHGAPAIETAEVMKAPRPDHVCADLAQGAAWILGLEG